MPTRTFAVAAAGVGAAVLAATGITYAATSGSSPASPSVHQPAAAVQRAAKPAQPAAQPDQRAAPAAAPESGGGPGGEKDGGRGREGGDREGGDREGGGREGGGREFGRKEEGRIYFNDRVYSAAAEGCITTASGLGSSSFNVFNDSRRTIEVFRGFTCDNGAPVATVGPHGATNGVVTRTVQGGLFGFGDDGVVGSFLVLTDDGDDW
ncbi:hypothetical protein ACFCYB_22535 [Streptomyces sp. NPDC056309]|uniref:hypothetical protein n=1 Tax=unclassified Streptomyces TaxID=2593676 RepID=UPI0035DAFE95